MKTKSIGMSLVMAALLLGASSMSFADVAADAAANSNAAADAAAAPQHAHRHGRKHKEFRMGVCVGQELAAAGVVLPAPQPGQAHTAPDAATKAAFKKAIQACRAEFHHHAAAQDDVAAN